jgi:uncharacterized protein YjbI with pentapeptide repeats
MGRKHQGLRRPSPDLISKAIDETSAQVTRIGLTFLGTAAFCVLSLFSPDSALFGDSVRITVPLAGPVSFFGFILLGPALLITLRVYLQIYVEHSNRLERLRRLILPLRAPTLVPLKNPWLRGFGHWTFFYVLPTVMILFAWKAAVFPTWGSGLLCITAAVVTSHALLPLGKVPWKSKATLTVSASIITLFLILGIGPFRRHFDLHHANMSNLWLLRGDLRHANLGSANLIAAHLFDTNLSSADLSFADVSRADLSGSDLSQARLYSTNFGYATLYRASLKGAYLVNARLNGASLVEADLSGANLSLADLTYAELTFANFDHATLSGTKMKGANLTDANLTGAFLVADLTGAQLSGANLTGAALVGATLNDANLIAANLTGANLSNASLKGADLRRADLRGADLRGADLRGTNLSLADLSGAKLVTTKNLNEACGSEDTKLPEGYTIKPCPVTLQGK